MPPLGEGPLSRVTGVVHWFLVVEVMLVLTTAPGLVVALLLAPVASNLPLYALCAVPVGPAVAAALHAWRGFLADPDDEPSRRFLRGYRLDVLDALRAWVPALVVLTALGVSVANRESVPGGGALLVAQLLVGAAVTLWAVRMLSITATFTFRWRDAARLSVLTLGTRPRATLSLLSLLVLTGGITYVTFDAVVVLLASVLTFLLARGEAPVVQQVRDEFVEQTAAS
ncbi:hypothetical protein [uncultured Pseudokineococcus sp.]|uniref:hypothetical protein n=1 Tax=uncultured Pseudokineococcus sp. TaxID=1642928 RepID=UPI0026211351|nr:hypothetical protein [uncultured Pseudokineococcus sp.]